MTNSSRHSTEIESETESLCSSTSAFSYDTQVVHSFMKIELKGRLQFDQSNVLTRLGVHDIDDEMVQQCQNRFYTDQIFLGLKTKLDRLHTLSGEKRENGFEDIGDQNYREKQMVELVGNVFEMIRCFIIETESGQYKRMWLSTIAKKLRREKDIFSFPEVKPSLILCDEYENSDLEELTIAWQHRAAFVEIKSTASQGPKLGEEGAVTEIVAQAANYARLHLSSHPYQLFSIGLLVFGKQFCVALFDRGGAQFSPIYNIWNDLEILILIMRRMCCEMSLVDFGQDPNVRILPRNDPISVVCRKLATSLINQDNDELLKRISTYPTYSVDFWDSKYFTIGLPIWGSLSLLGRGTSVWRVTRFSGKTLVAGPMLILKTAWRQSNRSPESEIMQRIKGNHDGLVKFSKGADVFFPSSFLKITTANIRNQNCGDGASDTAVLHRLLFETVGRPIWDFNSYLEFFLAMKAALTAHRFLTDQGILHRDISAGNVMLSWDSDVPDSQKGFLTDLEFALVDNDIFESKGVIRDPSTRDQANLTLHGARFMGTVQFTACELLWSFTTARSVRHCTHHDIESFVWVMYYAILRRIGYVQRAITEKLQDDHNLSEISRKAFKNLFGHVDHKDYFALRDNAPRTYVLFQNQQNLLPRPVLEFFNDLRKFMIAVRGRETEGTGEDTFGWGTHEELLGVLDKVITELRQLPVHRL